MATKLRGLTITKVALVPAGANPDAHMLLYKSTAPPVAKQDGTGDMLQGLEARLASQELWHEWGMLWDAFCSTVYSLLEELTDGETEAASVLSQSILLFQERADTILAGLGLIEKAAAPLAELAAMQKVGRKMSRQRLAQMRSAMQALQAVMDEATAADAAPTTKGYPMSEELTAKLASVEQELAVARARVMRLDAELAKALETPEQQEAEYFKGLPEPVRKRMEQDRIEKEALSLELAELKKASVRQAYIAKTREYAQVGLTPDDWNVLQAIESLPAEESARILQLLKAAGAQMKTSRLFEQKGYEGGVGASADTAKGELETLVQAEVAKGVSYPDALGLVTKAHPDLWRKYSAEQQRSTKV